MLQLFEYQNTLITLSAYMITIHHTNPYLTFLTYPNNPYHNIMVMIVRMGKECWISVGKVCKL